MQEIAILSQAILRQARPRLSTLLKLMFSEALAFGQTAQWLGSHGRRGQCALTPSAAAAILGPAGIVHARRSAGRRLCDPAAGKPRLPA